MNEGLKLLISKPFIFVLISFILLISKCAQAVDIHSLRASFFDYVLYRGPVPIVDGFYLMRRESIGLGYRDVMVS